MKKTIPFFSLHYKLADLFYKQSRIREAFDEYEKAYFINPKDLDVNNKLEITQKRLGHLEGVRDNDNEFLKIKPIFKSRHADAYDNYCFVLMPFTVENQLQAVYDNHIIPVTFKPRM